MEINQILVQKGNEKYETRIIVQKGTVPNIDKNMINSRDLSVDELKILNDFIEMIESFEDNED